MAKPGSARQGGGNKNQGRGNKGPAGAPSKKEGKASGKYRDNAPSKGKNK